MIFNQCILAGYLGRDPEVRTGASGEFVTASIGITSGKAEKKETMWVDLLCFNDAAIVARTMQKGMKVQAIGRLSIRESEYQGQKRKNVSILVDSLLHIPKPDQTAQGQPNIDIGW